MLDIFWTILSKYVPRLVNGKFGKERPFIIIISIIAALIIYDQIVEVKDNVLRQTFHKLTGEEYLFQGGSRKGTYYAIGERLCDFAKEGEESLQLVGNDGGSNQILDKLLQDSYSFGIVQEDVLDKAEISQKALRKIAPLYDERLHILYRVDKWKQIVGNHPGVQDLTLKEEALNPKLIELFTTSRVRLSSSPPATGNVPFATQVLELCGITPTKPIYKSFDLTFEGLLRTNLDQDSAVDVAFIVAGAPLKEIKEELEKERSERKIGLISIDRDVLAKLNQVTKLNYRLSRFVNIYHSDFNRVTTISSRALLLASNNISDWGVGKMVALIKREIESSQGIPALKELGFIKRVNYSSNLTFLQQIGQWGTFILGVGIIFVVISVVFTWAISSYKRVNYSQEITKIYRDQLPSHIELTENGTIPKPLVAGDNQEIITGIVHGISDLLKLAITLREDYDNGGIIISHQRYLLDNIYFIKNIFKTQLGQRMNQAIKNKDVQITKQDLSDYYTAGYLFAYDYNALLKHLGTPTKSKRSAQKVNLVK